MNLKSSCTKLECFVYKTVIYSRVVTLALEIFRIRCGSTVRSAKLGVRNLIFLSNLRPLLRNVLNITTQLKERSLALKFIRKILLYHLHI